VTTDNGLLGSLWYAQGGIGRNVHQAATVFVSPVGKETAFDDQAWREIRKCRD
jgi:hypothetical protein